MSLLLSQIYVTALAIIGGLWCLLGLLGILDPAFRKSLVRDERRRYFLAVCLLLSAISFAIGTVQIVWA